MLARLTLLAFLSLLLLGCQSAYYSAMESVGYHKRDILVDRIEDAREAQVGVKEQFASALERFSTELNFDGGELQQAYELVNDEYEASQARADALSERIDSVEAVADALFTEWQQELELYSNSSLRRQSAAKLQETRRNYGRMLASMHTAEQKMQPVLNSLRDQSLFLKHNLNARAVASLKGEFSTLKRDISVLLSDVETSIAAADRFMSQLTDM